jgi:hypothetical protein
MPQSGHAFNILMNKMNWRQPQSEFVTSPRTPQLVRAFMSACKIRPGAVLPLCAAPMAARHDDIRGLNPIHGSELDAPAKPRILGRVCPIPGFDWFASRRNTAYFFSGLPINLSAARLFLPVWTSTSRTSSTARQTKTKRLSISRWTSPRCQKVWGFDLRPRGPAAITGSEWFIQRRTVS